MLQCAVGAGFGTDWRIWQETDVYDSYVALGDSFTEGLDDQGAGGGYRGWADRVADVLGAVTPGFRYANLAVRGRRLAQIERDQVPQAVAMRPSLLTLAAGGNDVIGLRCDVDALAGAFHGLLAQLAGTGATVLVFTGFDARGRLPMGRPVAARAARYNVGIRASAAQLGARVVDLWRLPGLYDDRRWAPDRLHLSASGHTLVAAAVLQVLGVPDTTSPAPCLGPALRPAWLAARRGDADWTRRYLLPWVGRKLRGRSIGDAIDAKRPELLPLSDTR